MMMLFIGIITGEKKVARNAWLKLGKRERFINRNIAVVYSLRDSNKWREETGRQKNWNRKIVYGAD